MHKRRTILSFILVIIWMIVIFTMSSMTSEESNGKSKEVINTVVEQTNIENTEETVNMLNVPVRKIAHASEYFILGLLIINLIYSITNNKWKTIYYLISILICFLYACTDEYHQTFISGRTGQFIDVLIDTLGAILATIICILITKIIIKKEKQV